jgi:hypothetical protein
MSATPELRFIDVPPLFQQVHRKDFEKWARKAGAPPHLRIPIENYGPPHPGHLDDRMSVRFMGVNHYPMEDPRVYAFEIRPASSADIDAIVTWERHEFARFNFDRVLDQLLETA